MDERQQPLYFDLEELAIRWRVEIAGLKTLCRNHKLISLKTVAGPLVHRDEVHRFEREHQPLLHVMQAKSELAEIRRQQLTLDL